MTQAQNSFENGLMMDMNPINTPASVLTNCLNGTFLTFNGNEYILQNDMGNGKVETARLPDGYVPVGCTAFGGIIYIVSQNPKTNQCQIGCFPSPERNLEEDGDFKCNDLIQTKDFITNGVVKHKYVRIKLSSISLNPGDKFYIMADTLEKNAEHLTDYGTYDGVIGVNPKHIRLRVATLDSNNQLIYVDQNLTNKQNGYYIGNEVNANSIDEIQKLNFSPYDIFNSKINGDLYLVAQLEIIDTFSYTYSVDYKNGEYNLNITIYWTSDNWYDKTDFEKGRKINPKYVKVITGNTEIESTIENWSSNDEGNYTTINVGKVTPSSDNILSLEIQPYMEYGLIENLIIKDTIDFNLLGTGTITINNWQYYVSSDTTTLRFEQDTYPEKGKNFTNMNIDFYPIKNYYEYWVKNGSDKVVIDSFIKDESYTYRYTLAGRASYSGIFNLQISSDSLPMDQLYLVVLNYTYGDETKYMYKTLYTNSIFNDYYVANSKDDFSTITLTPELLDCTIGTSSSITSNINVTTNAGNIGTSTITGVGKNSNTWGTTNYQAIGNIGVNQEVSFVSSVFSADSISIKPQISVSSIKYGTYIENGDEKEVDDSVKKTFYDYNIINPDLNADGSYQFIINAKLGIYSNQQSKRYISYRGRLIPLLYTESDLSKYMLSLYTPENKSNSHFMFDQFLVFAGSGYNDIATVNSNGYFDINAFNVFQSGYRAGGENHKTYNQFSKTTHWGNALCTGLDEYFTDYTVIPFVFARQGHGDNGDVSTNGDDELEHVWWDESKSYDMKNVTFYGNKNTQLDMDGKIYEHNRCAKNGTYLKTLNSSSIPGEGILPFGLLIKSNTGTYLLSNTFAVMSHSANIPQRLGLTNYSVADILAFLLMQIYRYDSEDASIYQYAPEKATYVENVSQTFIVDLIPTESIKEIRIDGISINNLVKCLNPELKYNVTLEGEIEADTSSNTYTLNVENQLIDTYLGDSSNNVYIVKNKGDVSYSVTSKTNFNTNALYALKNDTPVALSSYTTDINTVYPNTKAIKYPYEINFLPFKNVTQNEEGVFYGTTTTEDGDLLPQGLNVFQYQDGLIINQNKYRLIGNNAKIEIMQDSTDKADYNYITNVSRDVSLSKMYTTYESS